MTFSCSQVICTNEVMDRSTQSIVVMSGGNNPKHVMHFSKTLMLCPECRACLDLAIVSSPYGLLYLTATKKNPIIVKSNLHPK